MYTCTIKSLATTHWYLESSWTDYLIISLCCDNSRRGGNECSKQTLTIACNKRNLLGIKAFENSSPQSQAALIFQEVRYTACTMSNELDLLHMCRSTVCWQLAPEAQTTGNKTHAYKSCAQTLRFWNLTPSQINKLWNSSVSVNRCQRFGMPVLRPVSNRKPGIPGLQSNKACVSSKGRWQASRH